jgi:mycothiol synthase
MRHILKLHRPLLDLIPENSDNFEFVIFDPKLQADGWLALNNKIFNEHPDQGNWVLADLANRMAEPWFDSQGFFLALQGHNIVGFCWTKIHPNLVNQDPVGEIYVIGVDPDFRTKGLGRALAITGLNYLVAKNLKHAMLYVDADNQIALTMYQSLGFN